MECSLENVRNVFRKGHHVSGQGFVNAVVEDESLSTPVLHGHLCAKATTTFVSVDDPVCLTGR